MHFLRRIVNNSKVFCLRFLWIDYEYPTREQAEYAPIQMNQKQIKSLAPMPQSFQARPRIGRTPVQLKPKNLIRVERQIVPGREYYQGMEYDENDYMYEDPQQFANYEQPPYRKEGFRMPESRRGFNQFYKDPRTPKMMEQSPRLQIIRRSDMDFRESSPIMTGTPVYRKNVYPRQTPVSEPRVRYSDSHQMHRGFPQTAVKPIRYAEMPFRRPQSRTYPSEEYEDYREYNENSTIPNHYDDQFSAKKTTKSRVKRTPKQAPKLEAQEDNFCGEGVSEEEEEEEEEVDVPLRKRLGLVKRKSIRPKKSISPKDNDDDVVLEKSKKIETSKARGEKISTSSDNLISKKTQQESLDTVDDKVKKTRKIQDISSSSSQSSNQAEEVTINCSPDLAENLSKSTENDEHTKDDKAIPKSPKQEEYDVPESFEFNEPDIFESEHDSTQGQESQAYVSKNNDNHVQVQVKEEPKPKVSTTAPRKVTLYFHSKLAWKTSKISKRYINLQTQDCHQKGKACKSRKGRKGGGV